MRVCQYMSVWKYISYIVDEYIYLGLNTRVSMRNSTSVPETEGIFKWPNVRPWVGQQIIMAMAKLGRNLPLQVLLLHMCPRQPNHSNAWQQTLFIQTLIHNWSRHLSYHQKFFWWSELLVDPNCHHWVLLCLPCSGMVGCGLESESSALPAVVYVAHDFLWPKKQLTVSAPRH